MLTLLRESKDAMTQQYLLDCMIQGFPEEFHINTLPELLETCSKELERDVDMKVIFINLMERLSNYLSDSGTSVSNLEINIY
jgi:vacuolar protein sorting-associated protein 35